VDVVGVVNKVTEKIESATHQFIEIKIQKFFVVSQAVTLPIQYEDVSRYVTLFTCKSFFNRSQTPALVEQTARRD
jgi:hypothetical protein